MTQLVRILLLLWLAALVTAIPSFGETIVIDEFLSGLVNGAPTRGSIGVDPGLGGLAGVAVYPLPFAGVVGDILMAGLSDGGAVFDVVRFNGNGTVIFYSDNVPTADAPADTPGPPGVLYTNRLTISEIGPEGDNRAVYTPLLGQPGFDATFAPTYTFISDGQIPEPGMSTLIGFGLLGIGILHKRMRRKQTRHVGIAS
jgi:hypothetical protein